MSLLILLVLLLGALVLLVALLIQAAGLNRSHPSPPSKVDVLPPRVPSADGNGCPKCGGGSLTLVTDVVEHDLYRYRCNYCGFEFNARSQREPVPSAPACRCAHVQADHERASDGVWAYNGQCRHCHCLDYSPDLSELRRLEVTGVRQEMDSSLTIDELHKLALTWNAEYKASLHCLGCMRVLSDLEWGEAQVFGGQCSGCRGNHSEFIAVGGYRDPGRHREGSDS